MYNIWFSNIPVYKNDDLDEFNEFLEHLNINIWGNEWTCFDYYLYLAFLIIKKDYKIKKNNFLSNWGIIEFLPQINQNKVKKILNRMKPLWIPKGVNSKIRENYFIEFHLDRVPPLNRVLKFKIFIKYNLFLVRDTLKMFYQTFK
jgi:hypothetical protein